MIAEVLHSGPPLLAALPALLPDAIWGAGLPTTLTEVAWLGGLVGLGLGLLYLLRPRRRRVEVPFGGLWQRVLQEQRSHRLGGPWRRILSLLILLTIAGLLIGALAEPLLHPEEAPRVGKVAHTLVIVDRSASMATLDGLAALGRTQPRRRLDEARERTAKWLERLPIDERVALMTASGEAEVLAGWGSDRTTLRNALERIEPTGGGLDLERALDLAQQMRAAQPEARVVLVSDAGPTLTPVVLPPGVELLAVGPARDLPKDSKQLPEFDRTLAQRGLDDLAVVDVRVRPRPDDPDRGTLTVRVRSEARQALQARLLVSASEIAREPADLADPAALVRVVEVELQPGLTTHTVPDLELGRSRLGVRVQAKAPGWVDRMPSNDWGLAVLAEKRALNVLLVGEPNMFLEAALQTQRRVRLTRLEPTAYRPADFRAAERARHGVDVVVIDQVPAPLPYGMPGLVLALQPPPGVTPTDAQGLQQPELEVKVGDHPLTYGVSFQDANVDTARAIRLQAGDVAVAGTRRGAAVMVARQSPVRTVEWGLDLLETDLVGRYVLPILIGNAIAWLAGEDEALVPPLEAGRPWAIEAPARGLRWTYAEPRRPAVPARMAGGRLLGSSEVHGFHVWSTDDGRVVARPTVLPASERPAEVALHAPPVTERPQVAQAAVRAGDLPGWTWLLVLACAALLLEWTGYLRRRTL